MVPAILGSHMLSGRLGMTNRSLAEECKRDFKGRAQRLAVESCRLQAISMNDFHVGRAITVNSACVSREARIYAWGALSSTKQSKGFCFVARNRINEATPASYPSTRYSVIPRSLTGGEPGHLTLSFYRCEDGVRLSTEGCVFKSPNKSNAIAKVRRGSLA